MPTDNANPWDEPAPATPDAAAPEAQHTEDDAAAATDATDVSVGEEVPDGDEATSSEAPAGDDGDSEDEGEDRRRVLVIAAVAFVLIAAVAFVLTRGGDDTSNADTGLPAAGSGSTAPGAGGTRTITGTNDTFDRPDTDAGLGALPSGAEWVIEAGTWGIRANQAVVVQPDPDRRNVAVVGTGYPDPQAQVRLTTIANGAGLVFRYQGPCSYWAVYAVPEYATWNVIKVDQCESVGEDGQPSEVFRRIPQAPTADGTTVGVILSGDTVEIVLNGTVATTIDDGHNAGVGRLGLSVKGPDATEARFDDFVAGGPGGEGVIGPGSGTTAPPADGEAPADEGSDAPAGTDAPTDTGADPDAGG